jgi:hypothetical protein
MKMESKLVSKKTLKEFEIKEIRAYIVHAFSEEHALRKFGRYDYVSEGDVWPEVKELGPAVDVKEYY